MTNPWPVIILAVLVVVEVACMVEIVRMDRKASKQEATNASGKDLS